MALLVDNVEELINEGTSTPWYLIEFNREEIKTISTSARCLKVDNKYYPDPARATEHKTTARLIVKFGVK